MKYVILVEEIRTEFCQLRWVPR